MNTKTITGIVLAVGIAVWVVWDLVVNFNKVDGDTISELTGAAIKSAPIIAVALGVITGHLTGTLDELKPTLAWIAEHPIVPFLYGLLGGLLFWNMGR
jgi:hypothetical protein